MEIKAEWSGKAIEDLSAIRHHYEGKEGIKRVKSILKCVDRLMLMPHLGMVIPETETREFPFRTLIDDVYKIVYYTDNEYIHIAGIFDCRQDSVKFSDLLSNKKRRKL